MNQAFCRMIWLLSHPLLPLPSASCFSFLVFLCVAGRAYYREREGVVGGGDKSYNVEKAWSSIIHSILSGFDWIFSKRAHISAFKSHLLQLSLQCLLKRGILTWWIFWSVICIISDISEVHNVICIVYVNIHSQENCYTSSTHDRIYIPYFQ
jgi:hypothetical protein